MEEAAGGVFSVKSNNNRKNATNIFIPAKESNENVTNEHWEEKLANHGVFCFEKYFF